MARKIIITERFDYPSYFEISRLFWLDVLPNRQTFHEDSMANSTAPGITPEELAMIQKGLVSEISGITSFSTGTSMNAIETKLINEFNTAQTDLNNQTDYKFYGSSWDGSSWTVAGN